MKSAFARLRLGRQGLSRQALLLTLTKPLVPTILMVMAILLPPRGGHGHISESMDVIANVALAGLEHAPLPWWDAPEGRP